MLRFKSDSVVYGFAAWLYYMLLFLVRIGQQGRENHYTKKEWSKRESVTPGQKNVVHPSLVNSDMIILTSLHTKLELFTIRVKALFKNSAGIYYLKEKIPRVSDSKIKEGIFVGPQTRTLI